VFETQRRVVYRGVADASSVSARRGFEPVVRLNPPTRRRRCAGLQKSNLENPGWKPEPSQGRRVARRGRLARFSPDFHGRYAGGDRGASSPELRAAATMRSAGRPAPTVRVRDLRRVERRWGPSCVCSLPASRASVAHSLERLPTQGASAAGLPKWTRRAWGCRR
jgi:hypothetical protein